MAQTQWFRYTEKTLLKFVTMLLKLFSIMTDVASSLVILPLVVMVLPLLLLGMLYILAILIIWKSVGKAKIVLIGMVKLVKSQYIDIIARDTIDEMVLHSLENKIELSAKTLGEQVQKWL